MVVPQQHVVSEQRRQQLGLVVGQAAVPHLAGPLVCWLLRRSAPALRYWCWQIVALKLLLMPSWIVAIPLPGFWDAGEAGVSPLRPRQPRITRARSAPRQAARSRRR